EDVDAERVLVRLQQHRHGDEKAAFERADLEKIAGHAERGLPPQHMAANGGGEARRHSADSLIGAGEKRIERGVPAGNLDHGAALKSRNTMSGALVLWRDGTRRPAHSSAALARENSITGARVHDWPPSARQPTWATSALPSVTNMERSAANGRSATGAVSAASSTM